MQNCETKHRNQHQTVDIFGKTQKESGDLRSAEAIIAAIPGKP